MSSEERWLDRDAGPVARPYTLTGGRTHSRGETHFDLIDVVVATGKRTPDTVAVGPELRQILDLCRRPIVVADLASQIGLSLGVLRVLLGDLAYEGKITILRAPRGPVTDERILRQVLDALHAL